MTDDRVKAGLLGAHGCGVAMLEAIRNCPHIELIALADRDRDLAFERATELGVEGYDDFRSLIVEQPMDILFVAVPPFACQEQLKLAAAREINVWRETPLARNVHEGHALLKAFADSRARLAIARRWAYTYQAAGMREVPEVIGQPYAARGLAIESRSDPLAWRGDSERAGGGALIDCAYEVVDAVVQWMGLPDEVAATMARRLGTQPYDTEDVASVALRYQNGSIASIFAHRRAGPPAWSVSFHGARGSLTIDPPTLEVRDAAGKTLATSRSVAESIYQPQIDAFAQAVLNDSKSYLSPAEQHLATVAAIETAYLSARTGEPESTSHLYHLHGLSLPTSGSDDEDEPPEPDAEDDGI